MRILSMTATFGKLENRTLHLQPGLNIIEAPNEWGKSTWCAFLAAMLYGMDTRAKSTKTNLADKERYAPWSGSPMAGRLEINWQGRDIIIERNTRGRVPLGEFRAYETASGLPAPELNAANCGQELLGVERSVFLRSGFIRFGDLPVTNDEALRRRLNALVTTGDESGSGDRLAAGLKELKNRCRYNRTGLIPQAEGERSRLEEKLRELERLEDKRTEVESRLADVEKRIAKLENHRAALDYGDALRDSRQVARAEDLTQEAERNLEYWNGRCAGLPDGEEIQRMLERIRQLEQADKALQAERQMLALEPENPMPSPLTGQNLETVKADAARYEKLTGRRTALWLAVAAVLIGAGVAGVWYPLAGWIGAGAAALLMLVLIFTGQRRKQEARELSLRYGSDAPEEWILAAEAHLAELIRRKEKLLRKAEQKNDLQQRWERLEENIARITGGIGLEQCRRQWEEARDLLAARADAETDVKKARHHLKVLQAMARPIPAPPGGDDLTLTREETRRQLSEFSAERTRLQNRLGQYGGRMEALGSREQLLRHLEQVNARLARLEETYAALVMAQETLAQASAQLQRRFAPRIAKRAGEWMSDLTGGRYDRVRLGEDLSLLAGAEGESTLREALWRSDGTVDQLYLALRLAVAEALVPQAPLILDDALVRFDDTRLEAALKLLQAQPRQVLLFTCQSREKKLLQ